MKKGKLIVSICAFALAAALIAVSFIDQIAIVGKYRVKEIDGRDVSSIADASGKDKNAVKMYLSFGMTGDLEIDISFSDEIKEQLGPLGEEMIEKYISEVFDGARWKISDGEIVAISPDGEEDSMEYDLGFSSLKIGEGSSEMDLQKEGIDLFFCPSMVLREVALLLIILGVVLLLVKGKKRVLSTKTVVVTETTHEVPSAFCENCGSAIAAGLKFCEMCGTPVAGAIPEPPEEYVEQVPKGFEEEQTKSVESTVQEAFVEMETVVEEPETVEVHEEVPEIEVSGNRCANCGSVIAEGNKFCVTCGAPVLETVEVHEEVPEIEVSGNRCANCGGVIAEGNKFCEACGAPVPETAEVHEEPAEIETDSAELVESVSVEPVTPVETVVYEAPAAPEISGIRCANCGGIIKDGDKFCETCGALAPSVAAAVGAVEMPVPSARYCEMCGRKLSDGDKFCEACGAPVASASVTAGSKATSTTKGRLKSTFRPIETESTFGTIGLSSHDRAAAPSSHEAFEPAGDL